MEPRLLVAERGLVPAAASALATNAFTAVPFERLGPVKTLLKRFFSAEPWTPADDTALALAVGPGEGWWREPLADDLAIEYGWRSNAFELRVDAGMSADEPAAPPAGGDEVPGATDAADELARTFDGPIVPEVTPNPRTVMFRTGRLHTGDSRSYARGDGVDDPRVTGLFRSFPDLISVLVARDFVALTLRRADRWEAILDPVLHALVESFPAAGGLNTSEPVGERQPGPPHASGPVTGEPVGGGTRLDRAWRELGDLRMDHPAELARVLEAARSTEASERQVAGSLLGEAAPEVADAEWNRLLTDASRTVRRSVVDAMVDAEREALRPSLEQALADGDAWVRWKALRGLRQLGAAASMAAVERLVDDPDFRVRVEAHRARET